MQIYQTDQTFLCGVGITVTGVDKELIKQVVSAYKQYTDNYGRKRITKSSLGRYPFSVSPNGPHQDILMFFVPANKEASTIEKLKEYGVDYFEITCLDSGPDTKKFFAVNEKKAVERIMRSLHIDEPEYVNVTFYDSGLADDKSIEESDGRGMDFGREVVYNTWLLRLYQKAGKEGYLNTLIASSPTIESASKEISNEMERKSVKAMKAELSSLAEKAGEDIDVNMISSEEEYYEIYNSIKAMVEEKTKTFIEDVASQLEETYTYEEQERGYVMDAD